MDRRAFLAAFGLAPVAAVVPATAKEQQSVEAVTLQIDASDVRRAAKMAVAVFRDHHLRCLRT